MQFDDNADALTRIQTFDKNSDGIVSETEMTTRAELAFKVPMHWNNEYYILFIIYILCMYRLTTILN